MAESFAEKRRRELGLTPSTIQTASKPKDSDFVNQRKMELGLIPDTRPKNQAPTAQEIQKFGKVSANPSNSPLMQRANQFVKDNPVKPKWNGALDNPITRGAQTGLSWAAKPFETISAVAADAYGAANNLIQGGDKVTGFDGVTTTSYPSNKRNLIKDVKDIWSKTNEHVSNDAWQFALPMSEGLYGTGNTVNLADVADFGAQFISPTKGVGPVIKGLKNGTKAFSNDAISKLMGNIFEQVSKERYINPVKLKVSNSEDAFNTVLPKVFQNATERMTPPLENEKQLAKWVQTHLNEAGYNVSINEVKKLGYENLRQTSEDIRKEFNIADMTKKSANELGYGKIFDKTTPTLKETIAANESKRAFGFPAPKIEIQRENFKATPGKEPDIVNAGAEEAQKMKGNWFTNIFGDQGIGISAVNDTKRISKDPLTTEGAIVRNSIKNDAQGVKDTIAAQARAVYQNHVDQLSPLKKISNRTYESAMDSARSNNLSNTIVHDKFVTPEGNVVGQSLSDIFKKVARGQDRQFIDYLTLRHSVTRMERGEQVYTDSLNMTPAKAQERLSVLEKRYPGFSEIAKEWDGFNGNVLQHYGVDEGLISPESFKVLREKNPYYSPMNRQFTRSEKPGRNFIAKTTSSSFSGQKAPIKEVSKVGSARNIVDPRKSTIENVGAWVNASMRNRTMQSMVEAVKRDPESFAGVAEIVQKPKGGADLNKILAEGGTDDFVEVLNQEFSNLFKKTNVDGENVVRAMIKGQPVYLKVHDPEIVKTLMGMGPQASNILIDAMTAFSNATKRGATGLLSPVFAVKGATMDLVQSAIQAENPAKQAAYTVYAIFSGIGDRLNIPGLKNMAEEFRRAGGEYSAALKGDRKLNKSVSDLKRNPFLSPQAIGKGAWNTAKLPFKIMSEIGNVAENAPRIAASKLKLNRLGGERTADNVRQAMSAGREATVNFSRKGAKSRDVEAFIPYSNAAVQGTYRILKGIKDNPVRTAGAIGTLAVLPKLYEYAQFHEDPDYQNLPARERMRFLIVHKNDDGTFTKIPMDPAYNSIGELTIEALRHYKDNDPTAFKGVSDALANAWTPPAITGVLQGATQGTGIMGSIEGAANSTVAAPAIAAIANKSFTGAPIEPANVTDRSPQYRYDEKTSGIAKKIGEVTGFSPMKADYILRSYGGDPARILLPLTSDVGAGNVRNTLLKNFIVDPQFTNTLTNDFYGAKEKLSQAYRDNQEVGVPLPSWYDENLRREITTTAAGSISKRLSILADDKREVVANKQLKATEKTEKLRGIQAEINKIYVDINTRLDKQKVPMK